MLDLQALLAELTGRARQALQADTAVILLLDRRSGQLVATAASGLEERAGWKKRSRRGCGYRWAGVSPGGSRPRGPVVRFPS